MSKRQNSKNLIVFIDYVPAELHENMEWRIVYYVKHPVTEKLVRMRSRVKLMKKISDRRRIAKRMIIDINNRLESGWNPLYGNKGAKEFFKFTDTLDIYIKRIQIEYEEGNLRMDTFKTYRSQVNQLKKYLVHIKRENMVAFKFDVDFVSDYLDYIRYDLERSARTRDNYLNWLGTLSHFLFSKRYITAIPTENFKKINRKQKKRILISDPLKAIIFQYWNDKNKHYLALCLVCYYCLIRRTEITKLRVANVTLINSTIWIDAMHSKNRKSQSVTIPDALTPLLAEHLQKANLSDFLFSADDFRPGTKQLRPDRITRVWGNMRKELKIENNIDWYSLKDSGITDLLRAGVPLISVRDQARHHSSAQTDSYTPQEILKADGNIKDASIVFAKTFHSPPQ